MKGKWMVAMGAAILLSGGLLWAQGTNSSSPSPKTPSPRQMQAGSMHGSMMNGTGSMQGPGMTMSGQRAMMNRLNAMDTELDALVQRMQKARGRNKVDAIAEVVSRLVAQRNAVNQAMASMQPGTMMRMMHNMPMGSMHNSRTMMGGGMMGSGMAHQNMMGTTAPNDTGQPTQQ
jgi:hypothetical protein